MHSVLIVGSLWTPLNTLGVVTGGLGMADLIAQAPVLGLLVVVVYLFLRHMRESDERRLKTESEAEAVRLKTLSKIGEDFHLIQKEGHEVMREMRSHMAIDHELHGRLVNIIETMETRLEQK